MAVTIAMVSMTIDVKKLTTYNKHVQLQDLLCYPKTCEWFKLYVVILANRLSSCTGTYYQDAEQLEIMWEICFLKECINTILLI